MHISKNDIELLREEYEREKNILEQRESLNRELYDLEKIRSFNPLSENASYLYADNNTGVDENAWRNLREELERYRQDNQVTPWRSPTDVPYNPYTPQTPVTPWEEGYGRTVITKSTDELILEELASIRKLLEKIAEGFDVKIRDESL